MADDALVPEGAAVLPEIPRELGVHPLLLAVLHTTVFLAGSDDKILNADAAQEALEHLATYLQRLEGPDLERVRADLETLYEHARRERWPKQETQFFKTFLADCGVSEGEA
jgi:hypothetical protein